MPEYFLYFFFIIIFVDNHAWGVVLIQHAVFGQMACVVAMVTLEGLYRGDRTCSKMGGNVSNTFFD